MTTTLAIILLVVVMVNGVILLILLLRSLADRKVDVEKTVREELRAGREESGKAARELREEVTGGLANVADTITTTINLLRNAVDTQLRNIQETNEKKLDQMRQTVDEKLQTTLEKRLGESFKLVSDRLEAVHKGLGEMQTLAAGVGDLKRVLTNVKTRGTWGEIQLGAILEDILTPDQYSRNVQTKEDSKEMVEFAVCLPGPEDQPGTVMWLPIDSKFPQEDYLRLLEATDAGDPDAVQKAANSLARAARLAAQDIHDKYINPPQTTDFALMFLPTEGLYAEILRHPGLAQELQQRYRVIVAGPTTLAAILSSLRMGFRAVALEKRASEVWKVLGAVKTEFGKFGEALKKVKKQLETAGRTIDETGRRTRAMEKTLSDVERLPSDQTVALLGLPEDGPGEEAGEEGELGEDDEL